MSKIAKIIALGLGGILVLILGVMAFILFVIDPNDYKQEIYTVVKDKTDMDLVISDRIEWQLWPQIGLKLGKVQIIVFVGLLRKARGLMLWFSFSFLSIPSQRRVSRNKSLKHRAFGAGQFLSRAFVVLLRKSIPQNHNLKTAA
ncbi:MAG: hypothetical protein RJA86_1415 [Pseudomonadota bacterium]